MFPDVTQHPALKSFEFLGRLGSGSAGQVFLARSRGGRKVAIKVLHEPKDDNETSFEELSREATLCVRLNHPAIVQVRAFVEEAGLAALVFDYVEGPPLARLMRLAGVVGARLPDRVAWHIVERILAALAYAHSQEDEDGAVAPIIHRDLSPSNVLIDWTGDVKITDFGIAKMLGVSPATRYGLVKGTLGCMAPEQARGEPVDPRADFYAAALLAWRLATGRLPFDPRMLEAELLRAMRYPRLRPLGALRSDLPRELLLAIDVSLSPELQRRTLDASELHRIVTRSMDVGKGQDELRELLSRWRAQLERVRSPRDRDVASRSDSSADRKVLTLKYEDVDMLEQDYPPDKPTVEAHALPGDAQAWAAGSTSLSGRSSSLPALVMPPSTRGSIAPPAPAPTPIDTVPPARRPTPSKRRRVARMAMVGLGVVVAAVVLWGAFRG